jgi:hypothetical protein
MPVRSDADDIVVCGRYFELAEQQLKFDRHQARHERPWVVPELGE